MISLWNIFRRSRPSTPSDVGAEAGGEASESRLLRLPPEIILIIADMLPTPSASCLALCSRRLRDTLGLEFWASLKGKTPDVHFAFLSSIAKDLPQYFVCQECVHLHTMSVIKWPRVITRRRGPCCTWEEASYRLSYFSQYRISFTHVQLAMMQHYRGIDIGFPLGAFQHVEVDHDQTRHTITLFSSIEAKIFSNELL